LVQLKEENSIIIGCSENFAVFEAKDCPVYSRLGGTSIRAIDPPDPDYSNGTIYLTNGCGTGIFFLPAKKRSMEPVSQGKKGVVIINNHKKSNFIYATHKRKLRHIAHQVGHAIGLGHSQNAEALMSGIYNLNNYFGLHKDDKKGLRYLFR